MKQASFSGCFECFGRVGQTILAGIGIFRPTGPSAAEVA
jgi:hypothetical protein